ncbi:hypothetical protein BpHYR1_040407 [Brachionus plicatilis]|uniref:Uncharacterized protein n=1 Tax=Brachionus plicatilis TaxID=10195 RepID=A0A3M7QQ51_BRAPC|nr:hypothetical protein BpHYR1_040407 [Brachionus plicatilis]
MKGKHFNLSERERSPNMCPRNPKHLHNKNIISNKKENSKINSFKFQLSIVHFTRFVNLLLIFFEALLEQKTIKFIL